LFFIVCYVVGVFFSLQCAFCVGHAGVLQGSACIVATS
jgi:hypothetical protein